MTRLATSPRNRHETEQSVGTPLDFFSVVDAEFPILFDLAASAENSKAAGFYFDEAQDSLRQPWHQIKGWAWLNPPFADMEPWARKAFEESQQGARVVMLVPASVGTRWFRDWVWGKAEIRFLNSRLKFIGHDKPFPKDLMLCVYERGRFPSVGPWDWKARLKATPLFICPVASKSAQSPMIDNHQNDSEGNRNLNASEAV